MYNFAAFFLKTLQDNTLGLHENDRSRNYFNINVKEICDLGQSQERRLFLSLSLTSNLRNKLSTPISEILGLLILRNRPGIKKKITPPTIDAVNVLCMINMCIEIIFQ